MRKKKKILMITFLSLFIIINVGLLAAGNYFYDVVMNYNAANKYSQQFYDETAAKLKFDKTKIDSLEKENVNIRSRYGYDLKGIYLKNPVDTGNTVIIVHGICMDKEWSIMKYAGMFLDRGYNVFVYDSRNHGESGGEHPSYGFYEKDDLESCISYIRSKNPKGEIGIHSESLGAASALLYAETYREAEDEISFIIDDSGYSDLKELFTYKAREYNVPAILRPVIVDYLSLVCRVRSGFFLGEVSPVRDIGKITVPVLFIHGASDTFTPPEMSKEMYNRKTGINMLYIAAGAKHAESLNVDPAKYLEVLDEFLDEAAKK